MTVDLQLSSKQASADMLPVATTGGGRPHTTFFRLIPEVRPPQRADKSCAG
ncbi:MAG: hypothetical protein JO122_13745, partial [Acetobacteraceae bacterium]|nr:hypothetical protein [Acetobacteraceae bacterium]